MRGICAKKQKETLIENCKMVFKIVKLIGVQVDIVEVKGSSSLQKSSCRYGFFVDATERASDLVQG